jgi:hypothetical protein
MRSRFLIVLTLFAPWALAGCEDGPNQSYSPAPNGAANNWNNSNTPGFTDPSKQGYTGVESTGATKNEICTAPEKQKRWAAMVQEPIIPPHGGGGIDLAGGDTWAGITMADAEKINCQSEEAGDVFGDGTPVNYWGDNAEVWFCYSAQTMKGQWMDFWPGYVGPQGEGAVKASYKWTDSSGDHEDVFKVNLNSYVTKNDDPYPISWFSGNFAKQVNELGRAWLQTYAPFLSEEAISNCYGGLCITGSFGNIAYMYLPVIGLGVWTPNTQATSTSNIIDRIDVYLNKVLPFAMSYPYLKLDAEGPIAAPLNGGMLGIRPDPCVLKFGMDFADFLQNCVRVTGDDTKDDIEQNKLFGGFLHGREQYHFDTNGVKVDFANETLEPNAIMGDPVTVDLKVCAKGNTDPNCPKAGDLAREWTADQSLMGRFRNDRLKNVDVGPRDNHGMGLIWLEYARIVQTELNKFLAKNGEPTHELGDPACLTENPPNGCTGMEGFVTCAPFNDAVDPPDLKKLAQGFDITLNWPSKDCVQTGCTYGYANCDKDAATPPAGSYDEKVKGKGCETAIGYAKCGFISTDMQPGMKPGHPPSTWCTDPVDDPAIDPNTDAVTQGFKDCHGGDLWSTSFDETLRVFGHGDLEKMPYEVRDTRFFFHATMEALVKYLIAEAAHPNGDATITDVHNATYNYDDLHFDSAGAGQWETAAYIDRRFVGGNGDFVNVPVEFTITADIKNGIWNDYEFVRQLYRGEQLAYTAVQVDKNKGLGADSTGQITNFMGSPVLLNGYTAGTGRSAYHCATMDPNDYPDDTKWAQELKACNKQHPPMNPNPVDDRDIERDEDGMPILIHYKGAFEGYATALKLGAGSALKVKNIQEHIMSAEIEMPIYTNPYDGTKGVSGSITRMVPYEPKQPGLGFNIPINGQLDKFISTYHCDLSGRTISMHLAWDWTMDSTTLQPKGDNSIDIKGFHADDFLGDVFLCQDADTKDLLKARMYTTTDYMLDWMIQHQTAVDECELIVRYSPFGNYPDYIASLLNGVMVGINQGGGKGRVIDAQMWIPGL